MKRTFDIFFALFVLLLFSPLMLLIIGVIWIFLGRPVFFKQERPGQCGQIFIMIKFRTMRDAAGKDGAQLPDAVRLSKFGQLLRSTSLDELPGLWNVLRGEMSLVGPRPLLIEYLPLYSQEQARRHEVRPGVTGWAQVNGRNAISWEEKFKLDVWYVNHRSFWLDVKVLWLTVIKVFRREGVSQSGHVTMEKFRGSL